MTDFDMPGPAASWEQRGGWVVRALVRDIGLTLDQAAGLVGNLGFESKGFTDLQEDRPTVPGSKGGAGWAQWTGYKAPNNRRALFEAWCAAHQLPPSSDEANYGFLLEELRGSFKSFTTKLMLTLDIEEACHLTHKLYETPSDALDGSYRSGSDRLHWAKRALAGARAEPGGVVPPAPEPDEPECDPIDADLLADIVRAAQRVVGADPDGIMGPRTYAAIQAAQREVRQ